MSTIDDLKATRALIADINHWTQQASARDEHGDEVSPNSRRARKFCVAGAINRTCKQGASPIRCYNALRAISEDLYGSSPITLNDLNVKRSRKEVHAAVLHILDLAIAKEEERANHGEIP